MATIHTGTTLAPTKLELLEVWLPRQPWYRNAGQPPVLSRAGGFRLDDPAGEVGIECMFVTDATTGTTYFVPLTYRGAPLTEAEDGLIGTSEHGVLGTRWVYDAAHDPVAVAQLLDLLRGRVRAQHQTESDTLDPSVGHDWVSDTSWLVAPSPLRVANRLPGRTTLDVELRDDSPREAGQASLEIVRVPDADAYRGLGHVEADWILGDGATARGPVAVVR